jgi:hypothetical protein
MTTFTVEDNVVGFGLDYTNIPPIHFQSGKGLRKAGTESPRRVVLRFRNRQSRTRILILANSISVFGIELLPL